jgi:DNA-binding transcriptional ArsR family regulator
MKPYIHPQTADITLENVLHALSDPVRLAIVRCLADGSCEKTCGDFDVSKHKSTMSHHLRVLREAGVIHLRVEGASNLISLRRDDLETRLPGLLNTVLRVAAHLDAAETTGIAP